jgi:hypothetical protein
VKYYDVQTELVDHLADAIEKLQTEHPSYSFRELLAKVDAQFAPDEFVMITKNKSTVIRKKYFSLYKEELFSFIKPPKIFLLALLLALMLFFQGYTHYFFQVVFQLLPLYFSISFFVWKKRLNINFGYTIFDSRLPLISLQLIKWVTNRIIIVIYFSLFALYGFLHLRGFDMQPGFFVSLYPILIVAFISAVNIQYRIRYQIMMDYSKAFE